MHKDGYAIAEICDILQLNRSSYYNWTHRVKSNREAENEDLLHEIGLIYAEHNGTYGYRRIADEYNATHKKTVQSKAILPLGTYCWSVGCYPQEASCIPAIHTGGYSREHTEQRLYSN